MNYTTKLFAKCRAGWLALAVLGLLLAAPLAAAAQETVQADSLDLARHEPLFSHRRLVVQYDGRFSIINDHFCTITGLKLGVEWRGRVRTGAAIYFLSSRIPTRLPLPGNAAPEADARLRFRYLALYGEYALLRNPRWEVDAVVQTGLGAAYVLYRTEDNRQGQTPHDFLGVIEPSVAAQMRLFRWASLGAGAGWRQPVLVPPTIRHELNGPIFYVRAKIGIGPLIRIARQHDRLFSQEGLRIHGLSRRDRRKFLR